MIRLIKHCRLMILWIHHNSMNLAVGWPPMHNMFRNFKALWPSQALETEFAETVLLCWELWFPPRRRWHRSQSPSLPTHLMDYCTSAVAETRATLLHSIWEKGILCLRYHISIYRFIFESSSISMKKHVKSNMDRRNPHSTEKFELKTEPELENNHLHFYPENLERVEIIFWKSFLRWRLWLCTINMRFR